MRPALALPPLRFAALLALCLGAAGCDTAIDQPPTLGARYTLWGAFDPTASVQAVRVVPIADTIGGGSAAPLGVTVRSTDLATRAETVWADTVVVYADGSVGHVFRAPFTPAYGSRHAFTVTDGDGRETTALVAVPPFADPVLETPATPPTGTTYTVFWPGAPRLNNVRVRYELEDGGCGRFSHEQAFGGTVEPVEFGWETTLRLREEATVVRNQFGGVPLALRAVTVAAEVASEDWRPPGGVFDPEVLVEPGVLTNVTGGFGFVGAAYTASVTWEPAAAELSAGGFEAPGFGGCAGAGGPR